MIRRPTRTTRTDTPFPYTTLSRSEPAPAPAPAPVESASPEPATPEMADDELNLEAENIMQPEAEAVAELTPTPVDRPSADRAARSEEHTSELQSLMRISYAVFCLKKKNIHKIHTNEYTTIQS